MNKIKKLKVGDAVYSIGLGFGKVLEIDECVYPYRVEFPERGMILWFDRNFNAYAISASFVPITPMEKFALQILCGQAYLCPYQLADDWAIFHGTHRPLSSRHAFGGTSAAYRTLRSLETKGILVCDDEIFPLYSLATA